METDGQVTILLAGSLVGSSGNNHRPSLVEKQEHTVPVLHTCANCT